MKYRFSDAQIVDLRSGLKNYRVDHPVDGKPLTWAGLAAEIAGRAKGTSYPVLNEPLRLPAEALRRFVVEGTILMGDQLEVIRVFLTEQ